MFLTLQCVHVRIRRQLQELALYYHDVGPVAETQTARLFSKQLCLPKNLKKQVNEVND